LRPSRRQAVMLKRVGPADRGRWKRHHPASLFRGSSLRGYPDCDRAAFLVPVVPRRHRLLHAVPGWPRCPPTRPRRARLGGPAEVAALAGQQHRLVGVHQVESARTITLREIKFTCTLPALGPSTRPQAIVHPRQQCSDPRTSTHAPPCGATAVSVQDPGLESFICSSNARCPSERVLLTGVEIGVEGGQGFRWARRPPRS
jgi:hypothetical protein